MKHREADANLRVSLDKSDLLRGACPFHFDQGRGNGWADRSFSEPPALKPSVRNNNVRSMACCLTISHESRFQGPSGCGGMALRFSTSWGCW